MKKVIYVVVAAAVLYALYYGISPLWNDVVVDDAVPEAIVEERQPIPSGFKDLSEEDQNSMMEQMKEMEEKGPIVMNDTLESLSIDLVTNPDSVEIIEEEEQVQEEQEEAALPELDLRPVLDTIGHPAEGTVRVIQTAEGPVARYENFKTINGPRLNVYLAKDLDAKEFIDLGPIRGTEGNINYNLPSDVDLNEYKYIMYWCVPFGVLFNYADISS